MDKWYIAFIIGVAIIFTGAVLVALWQAFRKQNKTDPLLSVNVSDALNTINEKIDHINETLTSMMADIKDNYLKIDTYKDDHKEIIGDIKEIRDKIGRYDERLKRVETDVNLLFAQVREFVKKNENINSGK